MTSKQDERRLRHMLAESQKVIARAQAARRADLDTDDDLAAALAWRLSIIGEAAARISKPTRDKNPHIPWLQIVGMRHRLIHGYDSIDLDVVWQTAVVDLPSLVVALTALLQPPNP